MMLMATCLLNRIKNILSLNPFKKGLKLELEEICMLSLHLIHPSMEVEETFLLETKEKLLKKMSVARPTVFRGIDFLNPISTGEL